MRKKNEEILTKICWLKSQESLEEYYSNLRYGLPWVEANSTVNLVPFGIRIMELQMCENCNFVAPVNIPTPFACTLFSWAAQHMSLDQIKMIKYIGWKDYLTLFWLTLTLTDQFSITKFPSQSFSNWSIKLCRLKSHGGLV